MAVEQALQGFKETESGESFSLQNPRLLKVELADVTIQAKLGAMVAYQGEVKFERAGTGGMSRLMKKVATGEGVDLMKVSGTGEVFLAFHAQEVHLVKLTDDKITVNSSNLLAFEAGIDWNIRKVEGASGVLAGGLFNLELAGTGWVGAAVRRSADAARAEGRHGVHRPAGRDHVVKRGADRREDRREPEDPDRPGLRGDAPDGVLRERLGAGAAVRGHAARARARGGGLGNLLGG